MEMQFSQTLGHSIHAHQGAWESVWQRELLSLVPYGKRCKFGKYLLLPRFLWSVVDSLLKGISNSLSSELQKNLNHLFVPVLKPELLRELPKSPKPWEEVSARQSDMFKSRRKRWWEDKPEPFTRSAGSVIKDMNLKYISSGLSWI